MKLIITKEVIGKTKIHSSIDNPKRIETVPLYKMVLGDKIFSVTRDTNHNDSYQKIRNNFGENSECPPNIKPYKVILRTDNKKGPRLQLYEESIDNGTKSMLKGKGDKLRSHIQIHKGKWSTGCFLVKEHEEFQNHILTLNPEEISVHIEPR